MGDEVAEPMKMESHDVTHNMIRIALIVGGALLVGGVNAITASRAVKAMAAEPWVSCLYNNKSIPCRRTFSAPMPPATVSKLSGKTASTTPTHG